MVDKASSDRVKLDAGDGINSGAINIAKRRHPKAVINDVGRDSQRLKTHGCKLWRDADISLDQIFMIKFTPSNSTVPHLFKWGNRFRISIEAPSHGHAFVM